jgi:hypothetical protein
MSLFHGINPKKISVPALVLTLLFSALAGSLLLSSANANFGPYWYTGDPPPKPFVEVIEINTDKLTVTFTVQKGGPWNPWGMDYSIVSVEVFVDGKLWSRHGWVASPVTANLTGLSNGPHTLEVTATADGGTTNERGLAPRYTSEGSSGVIEFSVDNVPPSVSVLSLANVAAGEGDFWFAFRVVGGMLSWVGYSLDGGENVTVSPDFLVQSSLASQIEAWLGNVSLAGLSGSSHSIVVYAEDMTGSVGASAPVEFTVETQGSGQPGGSQPAIFPTTLIIAIAVSVVAVSLGLLFYLRKRKKGSSA